MRKVTVFYIVIILVLASALSYYFMRYKLTFDYAFQTSHIKYEDILSTRVYDKDIVILYKHTFENQNVGLGVLRFSKTSHGWNRTQQTAESIPSRVTVNIVFYSIGDKSHKVLAYGYISDDNVNRIGVLSNGAYMGDADIINTKWKRIWTKDIDQGDLKIQIYDKDGKLIE